MRFGDPQFLWLYLGVPLLVGFFIWAYQRRQEMLKRFVSLVLVPRLTTSSGLPRQVLRWTMFLLFFAFLVFALARPRFGVRTEMIERKGVDIIVGLDISRSMLAEDITPNRLKRAKHEIGKFIDLLKGDRIGLIVFAGESYVQCPLTLDYGAAQMFLDAVSTDWVQIQGTALKDAIDHAVEAFRSKAQKSKVLVLLTDGESHQGDAIEAARKAVEQGVKIYTIGIGSEKGVPIPVRKGAGNVVYKKDNQGNLVLTKLDQEVLERVAIEGNGKYFHAGTDLDLTSIYGEIMEMEKGDLGLNRMSVYEERYQFFLILALFFLLLEFFIPERSTKRKKVTR